MKQDNMWIEINPDGSNLPIISEIRYNAFWVVNKSGFLSMDGFGRNRKSKWLNYYTHYMPVQKPQLPQSIKDIKP